MYDVEALKNRRDSIVKKYVNKPKIKPRFEQGLINKGNDYVGVVSEIIFLDTCFDGSNPENRYGLTSILEHPKIFGMQHNDNKQANNAYNGYNEEQVWQLCPSTFGYDGCPICDGTLAKHRKVEYKNRKDTRKNSPVLNTYMTVIELNPKQFNKTTRTEEPIINKATGKPYAMFKKLMPLNFDIKNSSASKIMDLLIDAYTEINPKTGKPYESIRGVKILLKRADDKMSSKIGEPKRYEAEQRKIGLKYKRLTEDELQALCGFTENFKDGVLKKYDNSLPYKYDELFKNITVEEVYSLYGIPYNKPLGLGDNDENEKFLSNSDSKNESLDNVETSDFDFEDFDDDDIPF